VRRPGPAAAQHRPALRCGARARYVNFDWVALYRRELEAPWVPSVTGADDTSCFDTEDFTNVRRAPRRPGPGAARCAEGRRGAATAGQALRGRRRVVQGVLSGQAPAPTAREWRCAAPPRQCVGARIQSARTQRSITPRTPWHTPHACVRARRARGGAAGPAERVRAAMPCSSPCSVLVQQPGAAAERHPAL
jgi:hypothetical protein